MSNARTIWKYLLTAAALVGLNSVAVPTAGADDAAKKSSTASLALGGYCPVSYHTAEKAIKGDPAHAVTYQGLDYHCANADAKKLFEANPEKYVPQYGGLCTTALGGSYGNRLPSDPEVFYVRNGKLYLFSSLRARNAFDRWPDQYIEKADGLYAMPSMQGFCVASYQLTGKAEKGDDKFRRVHRGLVYHFANAEAAAAFEKNPDKYIPKYDGFCAEGVSRGKEYPGDPATFEVIDGATYLFFDDAAKKSFAANAKELIEKAGSQWEAMKKAKAEDVTANVRTGPANPATPAPAHPESPAEKKP